MTKKEKMRREDELMSQPMSDEEFDSAMKLVNDEKSIDDLDPRAFRKFVPPKKSIFK